MELPDHEYFQPSVSTSKETSQNKSNKPDFTRLCRICASTNEYLIPIFEGEGLQLDLRPKVEKYLPVTINSTDNLPTSMCYQCASSILSWHDLVQNCVTADKQLRDMKIDPDNESWKCKEEKDGQDTNDVNDDVNDDANCNLTSSKESSSNSRKESNASSSLASAPVVPCSMSNASSNDSTFSTDVDAADMSGGKEVTSEKLSERAKPDEKAFKINGVKEQIDPELMVSLVPEVNLVEEESEAALGKRKRKRTSYFSFGDFVYHGFSYADVDDKDEHVVQTVKKSKRTMKKKINNSVEKGFPCHYCPANYTRKSDALRHERQKHGDELQNVLKEEPLKAAKTDANEVKGEPDNLEGIIFTCDECQSQFDNKLEMIKHLQEVHSDLFNFDDDAFVENDSKSRAKRYFCNICSTFVKGRRSYLWHHKSEHTGEKHDYIRETPKQLFHCDFCTSGFTRHHDLFRHLKKKHLHFIVILENKQVLRKQIGCRLCEAEFSRSEDAVLHINQSHDVAENEASSSMIWICSLCEGKFDNVSNLVAHGNMLHGGESDSLKSSDYFGVCAYSKKPCPATCDVCGLTFKQRYQLTTHKSRHITMEDRLRYEPAVEACRVLINNEPHFRCNRCSRMFSKDDLFVRHLILHDTGRAFCCHMCGFQCFTQAHLKRHMNVVHLKKRDYKCDICGHAFAEKQAMVDHRRTHTGERPCQCKICGKMFPSWTCVYTHKRSHTDYFPYPCTEPDCKSKFRTKYRLKEHMRRHTGEKPFSCPIASCGKTFHDKRAISRHLTVHTNDRPYGCTLCNRLYKHKKYLSFHMKTNHGIKMSELNEQAIAIL